MFRHVALIGFKYVAINRQQYTHLKTWRIAHKPKISFEFNFLWKPDVVSETLSAFIWIFEFLRNRCFKKRDMEEKMSIKNTSRYFWIVTRKMDFWKKHQWHENFWKQSFFFYFAEKLSSWKFVSCCFYSRSL